jgi:hypothetical protein
MEFSSKVKDSPTSDGQYWSHLVFPCSFVFVRLIINFVFSYKIIRQKFSFVDGKGP